MTLEDQIKADEGLRLTVYKDSLGKLTIGYGRCLETEGITKDEAEYLLANDIAHVKLELTKAIPWMTTLNEPRQAVLYNMAFNMGVAGVLKFKQMLLAVKGGDFLSASREMLNSLWAKQVGTRAMRLAQQMINGEWS